MTEDGLEDREQGPRSTLVADSLSPFPSSIESPPPLPARSPLRPQARSFAPLTDNLSPPSHMPPPISRFHSSSISIDTLVDGFPAPNIVIDDGFVNEKPRLSPFLTMPRTPSPDKPLPITPSPATSSPTSTDDDSTPDHLSVRDLRDSPPPSASHPPKVLSSGLTKRTHALLELIESERAYASDLALIRQVHLPVALGHDPPIPTPPQSSSSSSRTLSSASASSITLLGPPMTSEDARVIFSNISELAEFADQFVTRLETALGSVIPVGEGEDAVGALFIDMIPHMEPPYMHYVTHHPAALAHLNSLPQTPALAAYHATTRRLAQQHSHAWDLPSLLIKPVQRVLKYALLLQAIILETPDSHADKENLRRAKSMVEAVSHGINEEQRRREIVKEVLAIGKPADVLKKKGLGIVVRVRGVTTPRNMSRQDSEEAERFAQMERDMHCADEFIQKFAKETLDWVQSVQALMSALRVWAEGFGRVIGLGPDVTSEAFDAFLVVVDKQLTSLCVDLDALVREQLLPQLRALLDTVKRPTILLETLHALEPHHLALLQHNTAKGRPPSSLQEASVAYLALRTQLRAELPAYLKLLQAGVTFCVGQLARWQTRLWRDVRTRWSELWDALRVEGEMNAGSEETERVWRARWEEAARDLLTLNIINPEKLTPRSKQTSGTRVGAVNAMMSSLEPSRSAPAEMPSFNESTSSLSTHKKHGSNSSSSARRVMRLPSTESLHSIRSARSSSGQYVVELPESSSSQSHLPLPWRHGPAMPLRKSSSQGRLLESFAGDGGEKHPYRHKEHEDDERGRGATPAKHTVDTLLPSLPRRSPVPRRARTSDGINPQQHAQHRHHPPVPPPPRLTVSSRWYRAPALYACRVIHSCDPPQGVQYYGLPFFKLYIDDVYQVVKEAGHPSRHRDLPLFVDEGEDCLLLARDSSGALGWLLASFLYPVD